MAAVGVHWLGPEFCVGSRMKPIDQSVQVPGQEGGLSACPVPSAVAREQPYVQPVGIPVISDWCVQEVLFCNGVGRRSGNGQLRELRGARPPPAPGALYRLRQPFQVQARINRCGTDSTTG